jgi:hypothetical protein
MICPNCGSERTKKAGFSFKLNGTRQRFKCHECQKDFYEGDVKEEFPAVLLFDIETLPIKAYTWGVWEQNIRTEQIIEDWTVLAWSAKWLDDPRMIADCLTPKEAVARDDKRICQSLWRLLDDSDVVIAQNGRKFDLPKMNTRFWKHKLYPPSSYKVIDTLESARKVFGMTFNSLDYLGEYLGFGKKLKTEFSLWRKCDEGDKDSLERMSEYNQRDVELLESVYLSMRPYIPGHPKFTIYEKVIGKCPVCFGEYKTIGVYTAAQRQYLEHRCLSCHAVFHDTKAVTTPHA